jgi:hypothetical protein
MEGLRREAMFGRVFFGMSHRGGAMLRVAIGLVACLIAFGACAVTGGGTGGSTTSGGTATPTPKPCSTHATTTALTYASGPNLAGAIPAPPGAPSSPLGTISNFVYPLGIPDEGAVGNQPFLSFTAIAPDAAHLAVAVQQDVPFMEEYNPYIVDTATHAVTRVMLASPIHIANSDTAPRLFAWADTHTLIIFANPPLSGGPAGPSYRYDINTKALTPLKGVDGAIEGVVRCGVLFYSTLSKFSGLGDANHTQVATIRINRYDLASATAIGAPIDIGKASTYGGAEGAIDYAGWDASPDGSHIVYQKEAVAAGPNITSTWFAANADGSGAVPILPKVTSQNGARMAISPDATQVAVTNANPTPNVASGPVSGGSTVFYDTPVGYSQPAWLANSKGFFSDSGSFSSPLKFALFSPCGSSHCNGTPAVVKASYPATLP